MVNFSKANLKTNLRHSTHTIMDKLRIWLMAFQQSPNLSSHFLLKVHQKAYL